MIAEVPVSRIPDGRLDGTPDGLVDGIVAAIGRVPEATWAVSVRRAGEEIVAIHPDVVLPSASMGKVLVLIAAAQALDAGERGPDDPVELLPEDRVADSGLWQHLPERTLSWQAACVMVAAVSDNSAANALLRVLGLDRVRAVSDVLGIPLTRQEDMLRDVRTPDHPAAPSWSRAGDLARLMDLLASTDRPDLARVRTWLSLGTDLSLVASGFALDPLAHTDLPGGRWLLNKTGTDAGVRADAGAFGRPGERWSYAVLVHWPAQRGDLVPDVVASMRRIGELLAGACRLSDPPPTVDA